MFWGIKLHTHVEIQVQLLSIEKYCIYLQFYSFIIKKQNLRVREANLA